MAVTVQVQFHPEAIAAARRMLVKAMSRVRTHKASIGIHEEQGVAPKRDYYGHGAVETLAEAMVQHEFGGGMLVERSFLRSWFDANLTRLAMGMRAAMEAELRGDGFAVARWVAAVHKEWHDWIAAGGDFTGLTQRTIDEKRKAGLSEPETPLVATKQFVDAWRAKLDGVAL